METIIVTKKDGYVIINPAETVIVDHNKDSGKCFVQTTRCDECGRPLIHTICDVEQIRVLSGEIDWTFRGSRVKELEEQAERNNRERDHLKRLGDLYFSKARSWEDVIKDVTRELEMLKQVGDHSAETALLKFQGILVDAKSRFDLIDKKINNEKNDYLNRKD